MREHFSSLMRLAVAAATLITLTANCNKNPDTPSGIFADLVVYGDIFTSEQNEKAQAFAVKDGKYIAVGTASQVDQHVGPNTKIIVHNDGMVMAGCTEGHGHYMMSKFYDYGNHVIKMTSEDTKQTILNAIEAKAKDNKDYIFGFGFDYLMLKEPGKYPTRQDIDVYAKNIPVYLQDSEGHKGIANTRCIEDSGILGPDGKVKENFKYKDYVVVDNDGYPTGMLLEQAGTFVRVHGCTPNDKSDVWHKCALAAQQALNEMGYTAAIEGWTNKFGMVTYEVIKEMDRTGELTLNFGMAYEIENLSDEEVSNELEAAKAAKDKYDGGRVHANMIKLFEDGTPESGTGYMIKGDAKGRKGKPIWDADELRDITAKANSKGLSMHIHAMGDNAVKTVIDAYEASGKRDDVRNQIVHLRNVETSDYDRMAQNGIIASCGVLWHRFYPESFVKEHLEYATNLMAEKYWYEGYPYQSFINHKVHTSISTDAPASSGSPTDPFGIMEIAATGTQNFFGQSYTEAWDKKECIVDRADFLRSLTIEGAYQMGSEKARGSIAVGKYADFILISKNVLSCPNEELHDTKVLKTFFEGNCVYSAGGGYGD